MTLQSTVGRLVNTVGFDIDTQSWNNLKKFNQKLEETKRLMGSLRGGVRLTTPVESSRRQIRQTQDAHIRAREATLRREAVMQRRFQDAVSQERLRDTRREVNARARIEDAVNARRTRTRTTAQGLTRLPVEQVRRYAREQSRLNQQLRDGSLSLTQYRANSDQLTTTFRRQNAAVRSLNQQFRNLRSSIIAGGAAYAGFRGATGGDSIGQQFESLESIMFGATGSKEAAGRELQFLSDTTQKWGVNTLAAGKGFAQILAASSNTKLELEDVHKLFTATTKASVGFGMSAEDTYGSMKAFVQIDGLGLQIM